MLFGVQTINNPKPATPPPNAIPCKSEIDYEMKKHSNFIYAPVEPQKWFFWKRKFAFRVVGTEQWFLLPSLTPWGYKNGITKFGLNSSFVQKHIGENLEFATWL